MPNYKCKSCRQSIKWENMNGNWHPLNLDGTSHFDTCPHANQHRGKRYNKEENEYEVKGIRKQQKENKSLEDY